jgi:hypothetical protein
MKRLLRLAGLIALVAFALSSRRNKTTTGEVQGVENVPKGELGHFIEVINRINDESDEEYISSLAQLRQAKNNVLSESRAILAGRSTASFTLRHSALLAVAALRDGSALDLLTEVALNPQPLPPDPPPDIQALHAHGSEARVQHDMLALDALDGIVSLVADGHAPAFDVLLRVATTGSITVRTVALAALAARPERGDALERARAALPAELRHIGLTRFASVRDVPQIRDQRVHLAQPEKGVPSAPPLPGDQAAYPRSDQRRATDAPRIPKEGFHG